MLVAGSTAVGPQYIGVGHEKCTEAAVQHGWQRREWLYGAPVECANGAAVPRGTGGGWFQGLELAVLKGVGVDVTVMVFAVSCVVGCVGVGSVR